MKFTELAVEFQKNSETPAEALSRMKVSCEICSTKGLNLSCNNCKVKTFHEIVMEAFRLDEEYRLNGYHKEITALKDKEEEVKR